MSSDLIAALATGLMDLDEHKWGGTATDRESLRLHYERDAERFLLPYVLPEAIAAEALNDAADAIQALHPGEVKNSVVFLRERAVALTAGVLSGEHCG